jgi:hypothetical protein
MKRAFSIALVVFSAAAAAIERSTLEVLTSFGDGGRQPGQFFGVHNLDTDSKGNLYATETYTGARVQRFLYKGVGPVTKKVQGPPWPRK